MGKYDSCRHAAASVSMTEEERDNYYFEFVHENLTELTAALVEASLEEDEEARASLLEQIKDLHDDLQLEGFWHPYLTEAVADTADDLEVRVRFYKTALAQARELGYETHSILIDMAGCLLELGQSEQAEACAEEGLRGALDTEDYDYIMRAEEVLRGEPG